MTADTIHDERVLAYLVVLKLHFGLDLSHIPEGHSPPHTHPNSNMIIS